MSEFESCTIKIHVIEAKGLPRMDNVGWCDPYFVIRIGKQTQQTPIVKNTANPKYNIEFSFFVRSPKIRIVEISCYDWDKLSPDELIATFFIPFEKFENDSPIKKWFYLGDNKGEILLNITTDVTYKPTVAPMLTRNFISWSHPLVVYAMYNYTPTPAGNPNEPILDVNQQPLQQGFNDMELKENYAYLLKRTDYPWAEWSSIVPLHFGTSQEEDIYFAGKDNSTNEHLLALADPKNTLGGFAPTSYFDPTCLSNAQSTLLSNPGSFAQVVTTLQAPPPAPPPQAVALSSASSSSSAGGGPPQSVSLPPVRRVQRNYIPASHPLVVFAAHSYAPPAPTGEVLTDINGQPLEKGFTDLPLEAYGGVYLLKQANYPWVDWCTLTPLRYAKAGEELEYAEGKSGPNAHLLYLADPRTAARGGFAPTSYIDPAYAEAAQAELKKNPAAFTQAIALLNAPEVGGK